MSCPALLGVWCAVSVACSNGGANDASMDGADAMGDVALDTLTHPLGCDPGPGASDGGVQFPASRPFCNLSDYGLFSGTPAAQQPTLGMIPYEVNSPLFADYATKRRFLYVPPGAHVTFVAAGRWQLPVGAVLVKTFSFPRDLRDPSQGEQRIETRLLLRQTQGFHAVSYLWNATQTEATYVAVPDPVPVQWIDTTGAMRTDTFHPPNQAECGDCHGVGSALDPMDLLGVRTGQMNRTHDYGNGVVENQIDHLAALGLFDAVPPPSSTLERFSDPLGTDPVDARARSYLQANCAHCHSDAGHARDTSGLRLNVEEPVGLGLGICKSPTMIDRSGGLSSDIVPGDPSHSILPFRMAIVFGSPDSASMMPVLGRTVAHTEGVDLINQWIAAMPPQRCGL